jgi:hypothetical protein
MERMWFGGVIIGGRKVGHGLVGWACLLGDVGGQRAFAR